MVVEWRCRYWIPAQPDNAPGLANATCSWQPQRALTEGMSFWEGCRSPVGFFPNALQPLVLEDMGTAGSPAATVAAARWLSPQSIYISSYPALQWVVSQHAALPRQYFAFFDMIMAWVPSECEKV